MVASRLTSKQPIGQRNLDGAPGAATCCCWRTVMDAHTLETIISALLELLMAVCYGLVIKKVEKPSHETLHLLLFALYLTGFGCKIVFLALEGVHYVV